ncbi:sensor histidine kinase [Marinobacter koreensis]|uniref:histidine kinase n=1 Tax=Marinobacter koreensis TaxID=335974 RepID=A0ABW0RKB7_9GAMM|nr:ATP-binding protein [Marinobacter koreensis]MCK7547522.1 histidine kinase [Marinobacter koreensis]
MMGRQWPPSRILSGGLTLGLLLFLIALYLSIHVPWLGISTEPGSRGVRITDVASQGPLAGHAHPGDEVLSLRTDLGVINLEPGDAIAEPDDAPTFDQYNRFFQRQEIIWQALNQDSLTLEIAPLSVGESDSARELRSRWITISPADSIPSTALPTILWYQLLCGLTILWLGVAAWAYAQSERGPLFYALAGLGMAVGVVASAIYTSRELALAPDLFLTLSRINQLGAMIFAGAGTALLWYYPTRLGRFRFEVVMVVAIALILICNWTQGIQSLDVVARYTLILWASLDVVFAIMQWRNTRVEPVARARLKWFVYAWFAGIIGYLSAVIVPQILGESSLLNQEIAWGLFVLSYLGIALGIVRFRLFDLDRWILLGWFWFACGIFVVLIDALLILWLDVTSAASLMITLAVAGWVYFPLRQAFLHFFKPKPRFRHKPQLLPQMVQGAFDASQSLEQQWHQAMLEAFQPLQRDLQQGAIDQARVINHGLGLAIPLFDDSHHLRLSYAQQGHRLFDPSDIEFVDQSHMLFSYAKDYRRSFKTGVMTERARVARDLHDDVGARLLSVIYRADDATVAQLARDCLKELRGVIQGLQKQTASLEQSFQRWQGELGERCDLFGLQLTMRLGRAAAQQILTPRTERNLERIFREFLTNTLKHANARQVSIAMDYQDDFLTVECRDDGQGIRSIDLERAMGIGLYGIRERCEELDGQLAWFCPITGGTGLALRIPLNKEFQP